MADIQIRSPLVVAAAAIWPPICLALVAMRFHTRRITRVSLGPDDWLTIPALILLFGMCAAALCGVALHSVGYPTPPPPSSSNDLSDTSFEQRMTRKVLWAIEIMQIPALGCVKLSFIFFYRRIFRQGRGHTFNFLTTALIAILIMWITGFFFAFVFICRTKPSSYWGSSADTEAHCLPLDVLQNGYAISDFLLDVIIILFPMPLIWQLHLDRRRKIGVLGVFALGFFVVATTITRMIIYIESLQVEFQAHTDIDFLLTGAIYWSLLEAGVGLTTACLPALYGFFNTRVKKSSVQTSAMDRRKAIKPNSWSAASDHSQHGILLSTEIMLTSSPVRKGNSIRKTSEDTEQGMLP